jgi:RNA polymerase sigma-70 factor (family 1)
MDEELLLERLKLDDVGAFSILFDKYYKDLVLFAGSFLRVPEMRVCEDIVQDIFVKIWENRKTITIIVSLRVYLLQSVKNACVDELRHRQVVEEHLHYETKMMAAGDLVVDVENYILHSELESHLEVALSKLPPLYREVFEMNRFRNMKYQQIARELSVSVRTVEVRVGKAIALLRRYLKDFLVSLMFYF